MKRFSEGVMDAGYALAEMFNEDISAYTRQDYELIEAWLKGAISRIEDEILALPLFNKMSHSHLSHYSVEKNVESTVFRLNTYLDDSVIFPVSAFPGLVKAINDALNALSDLLDINAEVQDQSESSLIWVYNNEVPEAIFKAKGYIIDIIAVLEDILG